MKKLAAALMLAVPFAFTPAHAATEQQNKMATCNKEAADTFQKVQAAYERLAAAEAKRFHVVDAERDIGAVAADVTTLVESWLK